jgi:glyoxylase I family protein
MKPVPSYGDAQITSQGYDRKVEFLTDGTTEFHIAPQDLGVAFRTKQSLNPLDRGHIAFRTNDIEAFKAMLREKREITRSAIPWHRYYQGGLALAMST